MGKNKKKIEFSKILIVQESVLIWIMTLAFIFLAYICILRGYTGSLPWLAAMVSFPWAAYAISQSMYYRKSMKENTRDGIKFESAIAQLYKDNGNSQDTYNTYNINSNNNTTNTTNSNNSIDLDYGI